MSENGKADARFEAAADKVERLVATYDQDPNGSVTLAEIDAAVQERWDALLATGWTPPPMSKETGEYVDAMFWFTPDPPGWA